MARCIVAERAGPKQPLVRILWNDPHSLPSTEVVNETDVTRLHGAAKIVSVGWVLKEDAEGYSLAAEYCGDGDFRNTTFILKSLVTAVELIAAPRRRRVLPVLPVG